MTLDYKSAGVDKEAGYDTVERIKGYAAATHNPRVLSQLGAFGAFYDLSGYQHPILVSGTDGVGTKLKIAFALEKYDTIGIDAVAMCVNDILCHGAAPQYFLDYLACGKLEPEVAADIVKGVAEGCAQAGAALIDGSKVKAGDVLIGLPSSGFHSNGYSLLRKVFPDFSVMKEGKSIGEWLLTPTKIYVKPVLDVLAKHRVHGLAHITGGGIIENLPRAYGQGLTAMVNIHTYPALPLIDDVLAQVSVEECHGTFNMGIGFVIIAPADEANAILATLQSHGEDACLIGFMQEGNEPLLLNF